MRSMEFVSLCYHYIRDTESTRRFPRILGNSEEAFREHLLMLKEQYTPIGLGDVRELYYNTPRELSNRGIFITFDDGLSDHYRAAKILHELNMQATFFIPTCVLEDALPANPQIIHYILSHHGVRAFVETYHDLLTERGMDATYRIDMQNGEDPYAVIARIKKCFKYTLPMNESRSLLLALYEQLLLRDIPDIMEAIHVTKAQVKEMLAMGHTIGVHSKTHISVAASSLSREDFQKEIVDPRAYLEETFATPVDAFSYPFGEKQDCLATEELLRNTKEYHLAFTVDPIVNTAATSPFELGRYMPMSNDSAETIRGILERMPTP